MNGVDVLWASIVARKAELDRLRLRAPAGLDGFEHVQDLHLTHTSTAIEGSTLTASETTLVVEKGITIGGKPLRDHLEALDHFDALRYVRTLAREAGPFTEFDLGNLHRLVMLRSAPDSAGRYADRGRYVLTDSGRHAFPAPAEVPGLMGDVARWLAKAEIGPLLASELHRRLVDIHPFNDGNGRTARLAMNLVLIRAGLPPVAIRPEDRLAYLEALRLSQAGGGHEAFDTLILRRLDETLAEYVEAARQADAG